jgi:hypothetical protein
LGFGFSGEAFEPYFALGTCIDPTDGNNFHIYWDVSTENLTIEMPEGDYAGAGETITMSVLYWYYCLNGWGGEYNWNANNAPSVARMTILAAIEEFVLDDSRIIPIIRDASGSFLGAKFSYISEDYNAFMGYGGIRYMIANYTDDEWEAYLSENDYNLSQEYVKTE